MLSVSPPLHKDFRARYVFPSPGDGWRTIVPPPMPNVQPAFHFLSSLVEQPIHVAISPVVKVRPPMSPSLYGSLERLMALPLEVLDIIVALVVEMESGPSIALANHQFNKLATRHLYKDVKLPTHNSVSLLVRSLEGKPLLGQYIHQLSFLCNRPQWVQMDKLAVALGNNAKTITSLRVRFQSSDLQTAMPFFAYFSPRSFEWVTSPCWMMRPANLFSQFLSNWTHLRHLSFGNFRFDHAVVESISQVSSLKRLRLSGGGSGHLDVQTLSSLLLLNSHSIYQHPESTDNKRKTFDLQVKDCPLPNRLQLHNEILDALECDGPALIARLFWV